MAVTSTLGLDPFWPAAGVGKGWGRSLWGGGGGVSDLGWDWGQGWAGRDGMGYEGVNDSTP